MFTVIETRDFFDGIFDSREEAEQYLLNHPEKESCRLVDLSFGNYPLLVLEIGRGKFKYFENKSSLVDSLKEIDLHELPTGKAFVFCICEDPKDSYNEEIITPGLTLYFIKQSFKSFYVNQDAIGSLDHHHLEFRDVDELIQTGSLSSFEIE
jgi:hypothetical protein